MAMWAMMAAPLFMSNDLRKITPQEKAILLNKKVIAVDQDEAGHLAKMVHEANNIQVWVKKLNTTDNFAVAYLNKNTLGAGEFVSRLIVPTKRQSLIIYLSLSGVSSSWQDSWFIRCWPERIHCRRFVQWRPERYLRQYEPKLNPESCSIRSKNGQIVTKVNYHEK